MSLCVAAIGATAVLLFFGTGLHPLWPLMWFAPLPALLLAPRISRRLAFAVATCGWIIGSLNMASYMRTVEVPLPVMLLAMVGPAAIFGLAVLLARAFMLRRSPWLAALAVPAVWVTYEFIQQITSPHSTFGSIAYTQMNFLPVLQVASLIGAVGISFLLMFFPAAIAALASPNAAPRQRRSLAAGVIVVMAAALAFGEWRLHSAPQSAEVTVGLIASDERQNVFPESSAKSVRLFHDYIEHIPELTAQGAQVVVIPEKLGVVVDPETKDVDAMFEQAAAQNKATIVVGVVRRSGSSAFNEARVYQPGQDEVLDYSKHHMLPAFEYMFVPGKTRTEMQQPSGRWGVAICKDMDFPKLSRQYGDDGVGLMLVPAWDFGSDGWLHGRMAILRGIESGFSIARAPKQGVLTVTDDRGRVLAELNTAAAPFASLVARVPVRHAETLYARLGDWFGWLNVALLVALIVDAFRGARTRELGRVKGRVANIA